jgi:hypothetical protein
MKGFGIIYKAFVYLKILTHKFNRCFSFVYFCLFFLQQIKSVRTELNFQHV